MSLNMFVADSKRKEESYYRDEISTWRLLSRFHQFYSPALANHDAYHSFQMLRPRCLLEQHHP